MRSWSRLLVVAFDVASTALVALACGDDGKSVAPTYPSQGDSGTGSSTSSTSSGGSSGSVTKPDSGADGGFACAALPAQIDARSVKSVATPTGGTVMDGTYEMTSALYPDDMADGGVIGHKAATLVFSGNKVAWYFDNEFVGQTNDPRCCIGTWSLQNSTNLIFDVKCMAAEGTGSYPNGFDVTNEAGMPQFRLYIGLGVETFTKR